MIAESAGVCPAIKSEEDGKNVPLEFRKQSSALSHRRPVRQWGLWRREGMASEEERTRRTRAGRTLRNGRYGRLVEEVRHTKRLFTPEIKKFLKGWLVRRRKNPYPNRSEKKDLALKTGLTYMQICNWFANWRRKLKKTSRDAEAVAGGGETWGPLITGYNRHAKGNVEQFSISSDDSIWDEANYNHPDSPFQMIQPSRVTPTTQQVSHPSRPQDGSLQFSRPPESLASAAQSSGRSTSAPVLLKWLESAARFRPRESCWSASAGVSWSSPAIPASRKPRAKHKTNMRGRHREELDAAEALTFLSRSFIARQGQCV